MRFLHLIASVDPTGGGPIEGARHLHRSLVEQGHTGEFASLDASDAPWVRDFPTTLHALGPSKGRFGYSPALLPWLQNNAEHFDALIINGLWQYHGLAAWRARNKTTTPYFVFTHGMLDPWFKREYPLKHLKKWLYWPWAEYRVLRDANAVLFTCEEERLLARKSFWLYRCNEAIVSFGTSAPTDDAEDSKRVFLDAYPQLRGKRLILFLGRIHPKKGCDLMIEAFAKVCRNTPDVQLIMAGPDQTNWAPALQATAQQLGVADRVTWTGMLAGQLKWGAFRASEAFCLPSHQENFGIAVAEALACKCPVLISNKVNIWREIEAGNAGYVEPDTLEGTVSLLERWLETPPAQWNTMREAALRCFDRNFRMDNVARTLVHVVHSGRRRPSR